MNERVKFLSADEIKEMVGQVQDRFLNDYRLSSVNGHDDRGKLIPDRPQNKRFGEILPHRRWRNVAREQNGHVRRVQENTPDVTYSKFWMQITPRSK